MLKKTEIETYFLNCKKQGYSCEEIEKKLKEKKYDSEIIQVIETAHHLRRATIISSTIIILLIAVIIFTGYKIYNPTPYTPNQPPTQIIDPIKLVEMQAEITKDPNVCMNLISNAKERCLATIVRNIESELGNPPQPNTPQYSMYVNDIITMALTKMDPTYCERLTQEWKPRCQDGYYGSLATTTKDHNTCLKISEIEAQKNCWENMIRNQAITEQKMNEYKESFYNAKKTAVEMKKLNACDTMQYQFMARECKVLAATEIITKTNDLTICNSLSEEMRPTQCMTQMKTTVK